MTSPRRPWNTRNTTAALATLLITGLASAQYVGPSTVPAHHTVADILKNPVDDAGVILVGFIVKKVGSDKYIFSDGVSQIRVEIDDKHLPSVPFNETTRVRIRGEIEKAFLESPEIDVDHVEVLAAP